MDCTEQIFLIAKQDLTIVIANAPYHINLLELLLVHREFKLPDSRGQQISKKMAKEGLLREDNLVLSKKTKIEIQLSHVIIRLNNK